MSFVQKRDHKRVHVSPFFNGTKTILVCPIDISPSQMHLSCHVIQKKI